MKTRDTHCVTITARGTGRRIGRTDAMPYREALQKARDLNRFSQDDTWDAWQAGVEALEDCRSLRVQFS